MVPPPDKTEAYTFDIAHDKRIRVQLEIGGRRTRRFAVSLEFLWEEDDWRRVVCIDNWGGITHRDTYLPDGRDRVHHEPIFHSDDVDRSVTWAQEDLIEDAERYVNLFKAGGDR